MNTMTARDLMTSKVLTVPPSMTLLALERFLIEHKITGAPVVDRAGKVIGVVSRSDIVKQLVVEDSVAGYLVDYQTDAGMLGNLDAEGEVSLEASISSDSMRRQTVDDVMIVDVICVRADATLQEIAGLMKRRHIHRLIVTEDNVPIGIVSSLDLVARIADGTIS